MVGHPTKISLPPSASGEGVGGEGGPPTTPPNPPRGGEGQTDDSSTSGGVALIPQGRDVRRDATSEENVSGGLRGRGCAGQSFADNILGNKIATSIVRRNIGDRLVGLSKSRSKRTVRWIGIGNDCCRGQSPAISNERVQGCEGHG